jgi:hypothetical protein
VHPLTTRPSRLLLVLALLLAAVIGMRAVHHEALEQPRPRGWFPGASTAEQEQTYREFVAHDSLKRFHFPPIVTGNVVLCSVRSVTDSPFFYYI